MRSKTLCSLLLLCYPKFPTEKTTAYLRVGFVTLYTKPPRFLSFSTGEGYKRFSQWNSSCLKSKDSILIFLPWLQAPKIFTKQTMIFFDTIRIQMGRFHFFYLIVYRLHTLKFILVFSFFYGLSLVHSLGFFGLC